MKRFLSLIFRPSTLIVALLLTTWVTAATPTYTGSVVIASSGTYTDSNQTASRCARFDSSNHLVSASADCNTGGVTSITANSPVTASASTGSVTLGCASCVVLSPGSQQTGSINVSSDITSGGNLIANSGYLSIGLTGGKSIYCDGGNCNLVAPAGSGGTGFNETFTDTSAPTSGNVTAFYIGTTASPFTTHVASIDYNGNYQKVSAPFIACTGSTGVPCTFTWTCAYSSSTTCSTTHAVPASSICTITPTSSALVSYGVSYTVVGGSGGTATGTLTVPSEFDVSLSSTTLTITGRANGTVTSASITGNGTCL